MFWHGQTSQKQALFTSLLLFPNPISVHIVPVELVETDLVVEDINDDWSDEVAHEPTAWVGMAELVAQGRPLPPIEEELQEEETR